MAIRSQMIKHDEINGDFPHLNINDKHLNLTDNPKMKSMTIAAFGLLVFFTIVVAKPSELKEDEGAFAPEDHDEHLEALADDQSMLLYINSEQYT
jgi:hypothetical protein